MSAKPWWKRWWGITLIVVGVFAVLGSLSAPDEDDAEPVADAASPSDKPAAADATTDAPEPTDEPSPTAKPTVAEPTLTPQAASGFGAGTWIPGDEMPPGVYRSTGSGTCYWARLSGHSGELDDIIVNGVSAPEIVEVFADDAGFETQGCGDWVRVEETYPDQPATSFDDGTFEVGTHIEAGTYRADAPGDTTCYWGRLSGFSGELHDVIANGVSPTVVEIRSDDAAFTASGCGTWTRAG